MAEDAPNFEGHSDRECGDHRTVGPHRAWCFDCTEWCYPRPEMACNGCLVPRMRDALRDLLDEMADLGIDTVNHPARVYV